MLFAPPCTSEPTFQSSHGNGAEIMAEEFLAKCKQQAGIARRARSWIRKAWPRPCRRWSNGSAILRRYRDADCPRRDLVLLRHPDRPARPRAALFDHFAERPRRLCSRYPCRESRRKGRGRPFLAVEMTAARPRPERPSRRLSLFSWTPPITRCTIRRLKEKSAVSMRCPMAAGIFGA